MTTHHIALTAEQLQAHREGRLSLLFVPLKKQPTPFKGIAGVSGLVIHEGDLYWPYPDGLGGMVSCKPNGPTGWSSYAPYSPGDTLVCGDVSLAVGEVRPVRMGDTNSYDAVEAGFGSLKPGSLPAILAMCDWWQRTHSLPVSAWSWKVSVRK